MKEVYRHEFNWWQQLLKTCLGMWRINHDSIDFLWGYFAPKFGLELMLHRGGDFNQRYAISWCFIWGQFHVRLPIKTRIPESCSTPSYGICIFSDAFWIYLGGKMNDWGQCDSRWITWDLPFFSMVFDWHKVQLADGSWAEYSWKSDVEPYKETHPYTYTLRSGEIQEREATCFVEERQWHRKWLPFLKMNSRCISVEFSDEVGERTGSWKGGCIGCGYEMLEDESILDCLSRMEKERKF